MLHPDTSLVFVPDSQAKFVPARVVGAIQSGQPGNVSLLDDAGRPKFQLELPGTMTSTLIPMDAESLHSVPDMVELKVLTEASILHNLRLRFRADEIYTSIGDVLIAVNPFKLLPLYTPLVVDSYIQSSAASKPHIYKVADVGFRRLVELKKSQAVMVTGESGSGKTETTKVFLQYLAEVSSSNNMLSDKILKSNPLLESFGNASTRKNANSSRFGKLIEVVIDPTTAEITGAKTTIFLLEKSRLPNPASGERNFHIFYQLCAGARVHPEIRDQYHVLAEDEYRYLQGGGPGGVGGPTKSWDIVGWEESMKAMQVLKIQQPHRDEALRVVSGILHLGNLDFELDANIHHSQASKISNLSTLQIVESLLGLTDLERALTIKTVSAGGEVLSQHLPLDKAKKQRDALCIFIYSNLFNFLASRINDTTTRLDAGTSKRSIAVLDIFGFEAFAGANNSFEQLCINYCNEKLQHQFNEHVFSRERSEYEREGVLLSSNPSALLEKSQKSTMFVLELFEKPRVGLFHLMDEESCVPGGSDLGLLKKMVHEYPSWNPNFAVGKKDLLDVAFVVKHYVGPVIYRVQGMLEKNDEGGILTKDLYTLCSKSSLEVINSLKKPVSSSSEDVKRHLGTQFAEQLDVLVKSLSEMEPHFVRCIKPNEERKGGVFNAGMVLDQLRCAGILEVCRIRQLGFPVRRDFQEFRNRYAPLVKSFSTKRFLHDPAEAKTAVELMCAEFFQTSEKQRGGGGGETAVISCGKTKIFLKTGAVLALEEKLEQVRKEKVVTIQKRMRGYLTRKRMIQTRLALVHIQRASALENLAELREFLADDSMRRILGGGKHLAVVREAWRKATTLQEQVFGRNLLSHALQQREAHALRSALLCTQKICARSDLMVLEAEKTLKQVEETDKLAVRLEELCLSTSNDVDSFDKFETCFAALSAATHGTGPVPPRYELLLDQARAKIVRQREENNDSNNQIVGATDQEDEERKQATLDLLQSLLDTDCQDPDILAGTMVRVISQGLETHPVVQVCLAKEKQLRKSMEDAQSLKNISLVLEIKKDGGSEIQQEDFLLIEQACDKVEGGDVVVASAQEMMDAQNALNAALAVGMQIDFAKLRATLERAYACGLTKGELVYRVQKLMRAKNRERRMAKKKQVVFDLDATRVPEKRKKTDLLKVKELGLENTQALVSMSRSEGDRFLLSNYYQLKPGTSVQHQGATREEAMLETTLNIHGEQISKLVLGYTGERSVSFPPTCAKTLLELGFDNHNTDSALGDEIYLQLCAHLVENVNMESATRTWQLICLVVSAFAPSQDLMLFIVRFLIDRAEGRTDAALPVGRHRPPLPTTLDNYTLEQRYAWYCLKRLQRDLSAPATTTNSTAISSGLPSIEEIQAFGDRVPFVTSLTYPDGTNLVLECLISPLMTCADVTALCVKEAGPSIVGTDASTTFGLFVRPTDKAALAALNAASQPTTSSSGGGGSMSLLQQRDDSNPQHDSVVPSSNGSSFSLLRRQSSNLGSTNKTRFRLSITAVFGFARTTSGSFHKEPAVPLVESPKGINEDQQQLFATSVRGGGEKIAAHATPRKKTTQISVKRTEEEIEWDVPLVPGDYIGDVLLRYLRAGRGAPRLVFKKRLFPPPLSADNIACGKIEIAQAIDDFATGALAFDREDDVAEVVACRVALKFDNRLPAADPERLMAIGQIESLIPAPWKTKKSELNWARTILEKQGRVNGKDTDVLQQRILEKCRTRPLYGSQVFRVKKKGDLIESLLAVNQKGFALVSTRDHKVISEFDFVELNEFKQGRGGTVIVDSKQMKKPVVFCSENAREICELAKEYQARGVVLSVKPPASPSSKPALESPSHHATSTVLLSNSHRIRASGTIDEGDGESPPATTTESLRDRMQKMGATEGDISDVLRA